MPRRCATKSALTHDEQIAYYRAHPPSALAELTVSPIDTLDFVFDGHGSPINSIFTIACPCGNRILWVECHVGEDGGVLAPIYIYCEECSTQRVVYYPNRHGHDGEQGDLPLDEPEDEPVELGSNVIFPHEVIVRFEYSRDAIGEYPGKDHEMFSWITFVARDAESGELAFLYDDECA